MFQVRDPKYLAWIRTLPCVICAIRRHIEAAHTGPHGLGRKSPDRSAVPLCARHHRTGDDSYHSLGSRAFQRHHDIDLRQIADKLSRIPTVRVSGGYFVGRYMHEEYTLTPVPHGLKVAIGKLLSLCTSTAAEVISLKAPASRNGKTASNF